MEIPKHYKNVVIYNWEGTYYYKNNPCVKTNEIIQDEIIDQCGDRAGNFTVYKSGYIQAKTICGNFNLKINY